ncbi:MAG TPA: hypothetical protein VEQ86_06465, partial [Xanthobacteraceae bacterium]|nr:hypothetical protein [Xanthobacteraceae bacterium]
VAPFDITEVAHPAREFLAEWIVVRGSRPDVPDTRRLARLLRARRERPRSCAAEQRDERAVVIESCDSKGLRCQSALKALFGIISVFPRLSNAATPIRHHRGGAA